MYVPRVSLIQVTLEREGQLAGQEVQTDVLKMEVNALEMELRRARQDLGACEAGRREVGFYPGGREMERAGEVSEPVEVPRRDFQHQL